MSVQVTQSQPWHPDASRKAMRGRVLVRMRPGEAPESIPTHRDVISGASCPHEKLDGGGVDRVCRHYGHALAVTRAFDTARNCSHVGHRHLDWDDVEEGIGLSRTFCVELSPEAGLLNTVKALNDLNTVEMASPIYLSCTPFDQEVADAAPQPEALPGHPLEPSYAHEMVGGLRAAALEEGDPAVIVAIVDSGVNSRHAELLGRTRPGFDMVDLDPERVSRGLKLFGDTKGRDRQPDDGMGHGTACAGIIGALGQSVPRGIAGVCPLLPMRALAAARMAGRVEPTAIGSALDIDAAVKRAVDLGALVLNLSFGTPESALREGDPIPHIEVIRYAIERGCILVSASGNSGDDTVYFPAALPGVIAVGAVTAQAEPAEFTTRGSHVALSAPGHRVPCLAIHGYGLNSGTSFAAPFVSAACALLASRALRNGVPISTSAVKNVLVASADPFRPAVDSRGCGAGILDVPAALGLIDEELRLEPGEEDMTAA